MAWARVKLAVTFLVLVMMNVVGCRSRDGASEKTATGAIEVVGRVGAALSSYDIASISLRVYNSSAGYDQTHAMTGAGANWYINIPNLPVSQDPYAFEASAYDSTGQLGFYGSAYTTVQDGVVAFVQIEMFGTKEPDNFENYAPAITSVTATKRNVVAGETVQVTVSATDRDNDPLSYGAVADRGTLADLGGGRFSWTAPSTEGFANVRVSVDDGRGAVSSVNIGFIVGRAPISSADVAITLRDKPALTRVNVTNAAPRTGEVVQASVELVTGIYSYPNIWWSTDCGTSDGGFGTTVTIQVTTTAESCSVFASLEDYYSRTQIYGSVTLQVNPPVPVYEQ